jgi:hypothetical protein
MSAYRAGPTLHATGAAQADNHSSRAAGAATSLSPRRLVIAILVLFLGVPRVIFADLGQFQRFDADYFKITAALSAR